MRLFLAKWDQVFAFIHLYENTVGFTSVDRIRNTGKTAGERAAKRLNLGDLNKM